MQPVALAAATASRAAAAAAAAATYCYCQVLAASTKTHDDTAAARTSCRAVAIGHPRRSLAGTSTAAAATCARGSHGPAAGHADSR